MTREPLIVRPEDRAAPLNVVGTSVTVLADCADKGGMSLTLQQGDEGTGPPPHSHPWDEAFFVLEGTIEFAVGGRAVTLAAGGLAYVPAGTTHAFSYGPGGGKMIEVTGQGTKAATMFGAFDREMPGEPQIEKVVEIFDRHGVSLMA